jgi:hypothetical protein
VTDASPSIRHRERFATQVRPAVQQRVRAAVRGMTGIDPDYSLAQLTEDALDAWVTHLEDTYNDGQPWPPVVRPLRPGRR